MTRKFIQFIYNYHIYSILCGLGIIVLCMIRIPMQETQIQIPHFDKIVHFTMYLMLGSAYLFESAHRRTGGMLRVYTKNMIYCGLMAGAIELAQMYLTSYRSGEWLDWWFGVAGAATSCVVAILVRLAFQSRGR
jgi:VanZ family protein